MSAIRRRCFRSSAWASRYGRSHTVQFSNHTGYGQWQGRVFDAGMIREVVARHRAARRAGRMRRRAVGLHGRGRHRRRHPRRGGDRQARQPVGEILLRSGDRRRRPRHVRARGHSGIHERQGGAGRRRHHAQPVRARLSRRPRTRDAGDGARRGASGARSRAARRPGHLAAHEETPEDAVDLLASDEKTASGCARRNCRWW